MKKLLLSAGLFVLTSSMAYAEMSKEERKLIWKACTDQAKEQKITNEEQKEWIKKCWRDKVYPNEKKSSK